MATRGRSGAGDIGRAGPGPVIAIYLVGQGVMVAALALLSQLRDYSLLGRLTAWDGRHFLSIAADGYTWTTRGDTIDSPAFLPGYPGLISGVHRLIGISPEFAALAISVAAGIAFACAVPHIVRAIPGTSRRVELLLVALIAISPMSIVLSMAYSEALFCALAAWALVFTLRDRWGIAGTLALAAGTVRVSGLALAAAFAIVAVARIWRGRRGKPTAAKAGPPALAAVLAAAGTIGWMIYAGLKMGSVFAWFTAQEVGWGSRFDWGVATVNFLYRMVTTAPNLFEVVTAVVVVATVPLLVLSLRQRQPLLLIAYSIAAVALVVGSDGLMNSRIRLLIPAFLLLAPLAAFLARLSRSAQVTVLAAVALASAWFSAYGLTIWPYAI